MKAIALINQYATESINYYVTRQHCGLGRIRVPVWRMRSVPVCAGGDKTPSTDASPESFEYAKQVPLWTRSPLSVSMVNQFFAHYRKGVVEQMLRDEGFLLTWVCDEADYRPSGIPALPGGLLEPRVITRCRPLGRGLVWQHGVLRHALLSPDEVIVYTGDAHFLSTWVAAAVSRLRRRKVMFWTHGWRRHDSLAAGKVRRTFYRLAHTLLVYGEHARRVGVAEGYAAGRIRVIGNSMGAALVDHADHDPSGGDRHQRWVVITRLIAERRVEEVLRQVSRLSAEGRQVQLTVVGDGPERQRLEALATELGVDVRFLGAVYDEDATARVLAVSDVCLSPGNIGLAAVHALSCGCPVATHGDALAQMPEFEAVREGRTGTLFPRDDFAAMADRAWAFVEGHDGTQVSEWCHHEVRTRWSPNTHWLAIRAALLGEPEPADLCAQAANEGPA